MNLGARADVRLRHHCEGHGADLPGGGTSSSSFSVIIIIIIITSSSISIVVA